MPPPDWQLLQTHGTWKCCHWLSDCLRCSFSLWLSSLAASAGVSLGQEGSPLGCRAGAGEAECSSTCSPACGSQRADRRYSCSGICLILWGIKNTQDSEKHVGVVSVLKPEGPRPCWGQDSEPWHSERGVGVPVMVRADHFCFLLFGPGVLSTALHQEVRQKSNTLF